MKKFFKKIITVVIITSILLLSGCTPLELNIEKIINPPKLSELQIKITDALENSVEGEFTIKYPKSGKYSSGFNFIDLNGDNINEAICFFKTKSSNVIKMALLYTQNGEWYVSEIISDFLYSADVDFIDYREIGGVYKLLIGLLLDETSQPILAVYDCLQNAYGSFTLDLNNIFDYSKLIIEDYNDDGKTDLMFFELGDKFKDTSPNLSCFSTNDYGILSIISYQIFPKDILSFNNIEIAKLDENNKCLIIDAKLYDGNYTTYIYSIDGNEILDLNYEKTYYRNISLNSKDIDDDGYIEIPIQNLASGYTKDSLNPEYFFDFYKFTIIKNELNSEVPEEIDLNKTKKDKLKLDRLVQRTYIDFNNSIYFKIPQKWYDIPISIFTYQNKSEILFFINSNNDVFDHKNMLLKIKVYSSQDIIDKIDLQRYFVIGERNNKIYIGLLPQKEIENVENVEKENNNSSQFENLEKYYLTEDEVKNLFTIL